jgi:uncharacterized membrane protein
MFFLPAGCLILVFFILILPVLFVLGYFHVLTLGFEKLGISSEISLIVLLIILIGSTINIPLTRKKLVYCQEKKLFGLWQDSKTKVQGLVINLGGGVVPVLLSFYFLYLIWLAGFNLKSVLIATGLMIILSKVLAKPVPGVGISIPALIPPIFSAIFALMLAPEFAPFCSFVSGTLGVLIGGDILNLKKAINQGGYLSIGGAGVFDGIFLVGIVSVLLT